MKPKWQKAKILSGEPEYASWIGREIWVRAERPEIRYALDALTSRPIVDNDKPVYIVNLTDGAGREGCVGAHRVELLARDEKDFAEDVELIPWEQFLAECRPADSQTTRLPE